MTVPLKTQDGASTLMPTGSTEKGPTIREAVASFLRRRRNSLSRPERNSALAENAAKEEKSWGGRAQVDLSERSTRFARRIWEGYRRSKPTVALPQWESADEVQRSAIISLAAEVLLRRAEVTNKAGAERSGWRSQ